MPFRMLCSLQVFCEVCTLAKGGWGGALVISASVLAVEFVHFRSPHNYAMPRSGFCLNWGVLFYTCAEKYPPEDLKSPEHTFLQVFSASFSQVLTAPFCVSPGLLASAYHSTCLEIPSHQKVHLAQPLFSPCPITADSAIFKKYKVVGDKYNQNTWHKIPKGEIKIF